MDKEDGFPDRTSIDGFDRMFPDEASCLRHLETTRYGSPLQCPHCPLGTRLWRARRRKRLCCGRCGRDYSPTAGTIFGHTRVSLHEWFYLLLIVANSTSSITSTFVERHLGVAHMTAFRMLALLRLHLSALTEQRRLGGRGKVVQIDETWIRQIRETSSSTKSGVIVLGLFDQQGVITFRVRTRKREELLPLIIRHVEPESTIVTDQHRSYARLSASGFHHVALNHSRGQWSHESGLSMNRIESYWTSLKYFLRSARVNPKQSYFDGYLAQHAFMFNSRLHDLCPFRLMISEFPPVDRKLLPSAVQFFRARPIED